jgi:hypothetical protein
VRRGFLDGSGGQLGETSFSSSVVDRGQTLSRAPVREIASGQMSFGCVDVASDDRPQPGVFNNIGRDSIPIAAIRQPLK